MLYVLLNDGPLEVLGFFFQSLEIEVFFQTLPSLQYEGEIIVP